MLVRLRLPSVFCTTPALSLIHIYREMRERYGDEFEASMGAEAIQELLKEIDLDQ